MYELDDGEVQRPGDTRNRLDVLDDERTEVVDVGGAGAHDHVVGARDVVGDGHAIDGRNGLRHVGGLADFGLNEDVRLHRHA